MKALGLLLLGLLAWTAHADEPDPRAEMARALEAQADVAPAPPALPERAPVDVKAAAKRAAQATRAAAIRAAVHAAVAEITRAAQAALPANAAPQAQEASERAAAHTTHGPAQPGTKRH